MKRITLFSFSDTIHNFNPAKAATPLIAAALAVTPAMAQDTLVTRDTPGDTAIQDAIGSELFFQSRVDSSRIDVSVNNGVVTLEGTVPTLVAKRRAIDTARSIRGVRSVVDLVTVQTTTRADMKVTADIEKALAENPATEAFDVFVESNDGNVILTGIVESMAERWIAADVAAGIDGVRSIKNSIDINTTSARLDSEVKEDVSHRLERDVRVDAAFIDVEVNDGTVELDGAVGSAAERLLATRLAYVTGVDRVDITDLYVTFAYNDDILKTTSEAPNFTDKQIAEAVSDAILYDPRGNKFDIKARALNGVVTLTGTVPTLGAMRAAVEDARNTAGVEGLVNLIKVRSDGMISDSDLRDTVITTLARDSLLNDNMITITVKDGVVTLKGDVASDFEKRHAKMVVEGITGVTHVVNTIDYEREWEWAPDSEIASQIKNQLYWSPFVDSDDLTVSVDNGVAEISGEVDDYSEMRAARENAWEGGAKDVILDLEYEGTPGS